MGNLKDSAPEFSNHQFTNYKCFSPQFPAKELLRRDVRPYPTLPHQKSMNLIGEHKFLDVHFLRAQALQQIDRLREIYVAVVVSWMSSTGDLQVEIAKFGDD